MLKDIYYIFSNMPKTSNAIDYATRPISFYKFICNDPTITSCYVGNTSNFRQRKYQHKNCCNDPKSKKYNQLLYTTIRANGGFDNWKMVEILSKICLSKIDAVTNEQNYIDALATGMNTQRAFSSAELRLEKRANYLKKNAIKIAKQQKDYNKKHRAIINEKSRARYAKKKLFMDFI